MSLPSRPPIVECPSLPVIEAKIVNIEGEGNGILMKMSDAIILRDYIYAYITCDLENTLTLIAHIEKLENRIKALQGE